MPVRTLRLDRPLDLVLTLGALVHGRADPTIRVGRTRVIRATRTPAGPAAMLLELAGDRVRVETWGPGADAALEGAPDLIGEHDDLSGFEPRSHPLIAELARRATGLRIGRSGAVFEALLPAILEQKITGTEARRAYRGLIAAHGEPAPGPLGLRLAPAPEVLAALPYYAYHPFGIEQRRADLIRRVARDAAALDALVGRPLPDAYRRITAYPGIGPWTAAEVGVRALGDPDAVSVGDFHLPSLVAWALAREPRADDARMLELLEPWRGHRARVVRLLETSGISAPRFGPRLAPRSIAGI
ncbi:MAG TPA: hypothetical protein VIM30_08055 [Candidatus Limnocylindrales bacterium]